jgi:hypothetical protein
MPRGGGNREGLFVDSFLNPHRRSDLRSPKFRRSHHYNKISLLEIRDLPGLYHLGINRFRDTFHPSLLDSKGLAGIVSGKKVKSRVFFNLIRSPSFAFGRVPHEAAAMITRRDILSLPEIRADLAE